MCIRDRLEPVEVISEEKISLDSNYFENSLWELLKMKQSWALRGRQWPNFKFENNFLECFLDVFSGFPTMSEHWRDTLKPLEPVEAISEEKISLNSKLLGKFAFRAPELKMKQFCFGTKNVEKCWFFDENGCLVFQIDVKWSQRVPGGVWCPLRSV